MTKRYREHLDEVEVAADAPAAFTWRGQRYRVVQVLGHWYEDENWWQRPGGLPEQLRRTDLWRVEARRGTPGHHPQRSGRERGIYEVVRRDGAWRLDRVWD